MTTAGGARVDKSPPAAIVQINLGSRSRLSAETTGPIDRSESRFLVVYPASVNKPLLRGRLSISLFYFFLNFVRHAKRVGRACEFILSSSPQQLIHPLCGGATGLCLLCPCPETRQLSCATLNLLGSRRVSVPGSGDVCAQVCVSVCVCSPVIHPYLRQRVGGKNRRLRCFHLPTRPRLQSGWN